VRSLPVTVHRSPAKKTSSAFIVTISYWALLASSESFATPYDGIIKLPLVCARILTRPPPLAWNNVSVHIFNVVFALFEILLTFIGPIPWLYLPLCIFIIGLYIALAYVTHASQHFYRLSLNLYPPLGIIRADSAAIHIAYGFLDPSQYGGLVAAYVFGVLIGECVIFSIAWGISKLRNKIFANRRTTTPGDTPSEKDKLGQV